MNSPNTHIYWIPGLAAGAEIFEYLQLPEDRFENHFLEWLIPTSTQESLETYAARMAALVKHPNAVLAGVSFGGIVAQEMSKHLPHCRVVIISSVKNRAELPRRLKLIQKTRLYTLLPTGHIDAVERLLELAFGNLAIKRIELYRTYLSVRDQTYLDWALHHVLNWKQESTGRVDLHIHGDRDEVFPIKNLSGCRIIKGGSHVMIINKAKSICRVIQEEL